MTQLDETLVEFLLLCHVSLVLDGGDGESLPELVDRVRATIQIQDVSALDGLNAKLIEAGYLDSHSESVFRYAIQAPGDKVLQGNQRLSTDCSERSLWRNLRMLLQGSPRRHARRTKWEAPRRLQRC